MRLMSRIRDGRTSRIVALEIASGARTGERYQIDLRGAGIENLVLDVTIVVA